MRELIWSPFAGSIVLFVVLLALYVGIYCATPRRPLEKGTRWE